jgi:hypothetical protein
VKRILVFPCGSEIGLEIYRALRYSSHFELVGASSGEDHGRFVYEDYVDGLPDHQHPDFPEALNVVVRERGIEAVYPATDAVAETLASWSAQYGVSVVGSSSEVAEICASKMATYSALEGVVPIPRIYRGLQDVNVFPVFIKPDRGHSSINTFRAFDLDSAVSFLTNARNQNMLILEDLPGDEWTVDCFSDRHGKLRYNAARQRKRVRSGISTRTEWSTAHEGLFGDWALAINETLQPQGAWFFQAKESVEGDPKLLEVAARPAGSSALSRCQGVNLPLLSVFDAMGVDVTITRNSYSLELDRALGNRYRLSLEYDHVFVDLDDCLIIRGELNLNLVRFLFQSVASGKMLTLLTRHPGNPEVTLSGFRLGDLFDRIICLSSRLDRKSDHIDSLSAIFIDDSYAEREEVNRVHGISVFSPDMVEALF